MIPAIRSIIAALSAACATASMLYSPMLLLAIATAQDDWRLQMYAPQIDRVPPLVHTGSVLVFLVLAAVMCVDVCAAYPDWKRFTLGGCAAAVLAVLGYWFFWGPIP